MNEIIITIIGVCSTLLTAILTHTVTKRKYAAEVDNTLINNMSDALTFYKNLSDDNRERLNILQRIITEQEKQIEQIKIDMANLQKSICKNTTCKNRNL